MRKKLHSSIIFEDDKCQKFCPTLDLVPRSNSTVRSKYFGVKSSSAPAKRAAQMQTSVAKNTVCKKYKESMGFTSRTVFLSRADPMSEEILRFLAGYDMLVHESFGQGSLACIHYF